MKKYFYVIILLLFAFPSKAQLLDGTYVLANYENQAYVMDVTDGRYFNGTKLQVWEYYSDSPIQHFKFEKVNSNIVIRTLFNTKKALDVTDGKVINNNPIQIWETYPNNNNQRLIIEHIGDKGIIYIVRSALNPDYVLSVQSPVKNGSKVCLQRYTGAKNQQWVIFSLDDEYYNLYKAAFDNAKK